MQPNLLTQKAIIAAQSKGFKKKQANQRKKIKRTKFTKKDDEILCSLVEKYGENEWTLVAKHMTNKNSRQVRDRWKNYLNPTLNCNEWSYEEDGLLISKFNEFGPRWKKISLNFPNRSINSVRNRLIKIMNNKKIKYSPLASNKQSQTSLFANERLPSNTNNLDKSNDFSLPNNNKEQHLVSSDKSSDKNKIKEQNVDRENLIDFLSYSSDDNTQFLWGI